jgi:hypothetical protein
MSQCGISVAGGTVFGGAAARQGLDNKYGACGVGWSLKQWRVRLGVGVRPGVGADSERQIMHRPKNGGSKNGGTED